MNKAFQRNHVSVLVSLLLLFFTVNCNKGNTQNADSGIVDGPISDGIVSDGAVVVKDECTAPTGPGVEHQGDITADETWKAEDNPHIVTFDLAVKSGTLTLMPCVIVRVKEGYNITVGGTSDAPNAAIVALGERTLNSDGSVSLKQVTFMPDEAGIHWGSIRVFPTGRIDLNETTLKNGGAQATAQNAGGTIVATGGGTSSLVRHVKVRNVRIEDSGGFGVNLQQLSAFTEDSDGLEIHGSGKEPTPNNVDTRYPVFIAPPAVQSLPKGNYTGNAVDEISIFNERIVDIDETFPDRGVPYHMQTGFSMSPKKTVAEGGLITLTVEPGVTMKFGNDPGNVWAMNLGTSNGSKPENIWPVRLVAQGTEEKPIVLTSREKTPAAGDWSGIEWHGGPVKGNVMSHVRVEYAGGDSGTSGFGCGPTDNDAALIIRNWRPEEGFISSCTFSNSAGGGIVSGWSSDEDGPNFSSGNTFTAIANSCNVSRWGDANGACPGNDANPDCF